MDDQHENDTPTRELPRWQPPERCANCGAHLQEVPFNGTNCPHCGDDLEAQQQAGRVWKD